MHSPVQSVRSRWFISAATAWSAILYAAFATAFAPLGLDPYLYHGGWSDPALLRVAAGALTAGLILGVVRERSLSLWPGVLAHYATLLFVSLGREVTRAF